MGISGRSTTGLLLAIVALTVSGCLQGPGMEPRLPEPAALPAAMAFILDGPLGIEPVIRVADTGTVYVAAAGRDSEGVLGTHVWVGQESGTSWSYLGDASPDGGTREGDMALAPDGTVYVIDMDATGAAPTCLTLSRLGPGRAWHHDTGVCPAQVPMDRPWIAIDEEGVIGIYARNPNTGMQWLGTRAEGEDEFEWQPIGLASERFGGRLAARGDAFLMPYTPDSESGASAASDLANTLGLGGLHVASTGDRGESWQTQSISMSPVASGYGFTSVAWRGATGMAAHTITRGPLSLSDQAGNTHFGPDDVQAYLYDAAQGAFVEGPLLDDAGWNGFVWNAARNGTVAAVWVHADQAGGDAAVSEVGELRVRFWLRGADADAGLLCELSDPIRGPGSPPSGGSPFHEFLGAEVAEDGTLYVAFSSFGADPPRFVVHRIPSHAACPAPAG